MYQAGLDGNLDAASLVGYNSLTKQIIKSFSIPFEGNVPVGLSAVDDLPEPIKLDKPKAKLKLVKGKRDNGEDETKDK